MISKYVSCTNDIPEHISCFEKYKRQLHFLFSKIPTTGFRGDG